MNTNQKWNAGLAGAVAIVSFPLLAVLIASTNLDNYDAAMLPALVAIIFGVSLSSVCWNYLRAAQPASNLEPMPVPPAIRARAITPARWRAGLAGAVALLLFPLLTLIVLATDFQDLRAGVFPAILAFIFGAALASVCWRNIAANVRAR